MGVTLPGTGTTIKTDTESGQVIQHVVATGYGDVIDLTASLDAGGAYGSGEVLFDTQVLSNAARVSGGRVRLDSVEILDEDDQGIAMTLVFLQSNTSLGSENSAPNISDANARNILGIVPIVSGDYADLGGCKVGTKTNIGLLMKASGGRDLYVGAITGGTPTHTASGLRFKFAFTWDPV